MGIAVLGLALYLWLMGKWGKYLRAKNTPLGRRRLYGILGVLPQLVAPFYFEYGSYSSDLFVLMLLSCSAVAILGFITVAYAPKWIVGAPKPVGNSAAK
jgi:hypothetical protein